MKKNIAVIGATGNLGNRIIKFLIEKDANVTAVVRHSSDAKTLNILEYLGVKIIKADFNNIQDLTKAFQENSCVVSALAGLRDVIIDTQTIVLNAAIAAGVPRFIPSDYSLDFTKFSAGENRNLDWRREFHQLIDAKKIAATSIFNGAFADMLTGQMPLVLFKQKKILYWGDANHKMCFTTIENTAEYTACVALDDSSPRYLRIAGDLKSPKEMQALMSEITNVKYGSIRPGGKGLLGFLINVAKVASPGKKEIYPPFQGMQYMHNMIDMRAKLEFVENDRYSGIKWTTAKDVLEKHLNSEN